MCDWKVPATSDGTTTDGIGFRVFFVDFKDGAIRDYVWICGSYVLGYGPSRVKLGDVVLFGTRVAPTCIILLIN